MNLVITRITPTKDDREGFPELHAEFDVEMAHASLRKCKLLRNFDGDFFMVAPFEVKIANGRLRDEIVDAALDALDEVDPED